MDQEADKKAQKELPKNFRQAYIIAHAIAYIIVVCVDTPLRGSILGDSPGLFYCFTILYFISQYFYSGCCGCPGYVTAEPENAQGLFFCEKCQIHVPPRCAHCNACKHCVIRRDHHCPWTGNCIGRDNHLSFILFLDFELAADSIGMYCIIKGLMKIKYTYIIRAIAETLPLLFAFVLCAFALFQLSLLVFEQTGMILANRTVWEVSRREHITYLKEAPMFYNPFDQGIVGNVKEFLTMKKKKTMWQTPPPLTMDIYEKRMSGNFGNQVDSASHALFALTKIYDKNT